MDGWTDERQPKTGDISAAELKAQAALITEINTWRTLRGLHVYTQNAHHKFTCIARTCSVKCGWQPVSPEKNSQHAQHSWASGSTVVHNSQQYMPQVLQLSIIEASKTPCRATIMIATRFYIAYRTNDISITTIFNSTGGSFGGLLKYQNVHVFTL